MIRKLSGDPAAVKRRIESGSNSRLSTCQCDPLHRRPTRQCRVLQV